MAVDVTAASVLYDAQEYLIAGPANQAEWWEHLGDAHRDYAALAQVAVTQAAALREIGLPSHVPQGFDPFDWWKHTACKRGEIARNALGVTAEELIRDQWETIA